MNILITGTNGFIGRNLKDHFEKKEAKLNTPKRDELNLLNSDEVKNYIRENNFDIVIHSCVTLTSIEQNLKMYFNLERLSQFYGKLICIGSGAEFNAKNYVPKMNEDYFNKHVPSKDDIYGFSKYEIAKDILKKEKKYL